MRLLETYRAGVKRGKHTVGSDLTSFNGIKIEEATSQKIVRSELTLNIHFSLEKFPNT
jgi:hypothetical protein